MKDKQETGIRDNVAFDEAIRSEGIRWLCGVDEAGRGPLAGPVYAAAVVFFPEWVPEGLNDSKKLTEKRREELFDVICAEAAAYSIAFATPEEIDRLNILQATFLAMRRAVEGLSLPPELILVDGNRAPSEWRTPVRTIVKGDALSASISAASILAKVSRDREMLRLDVLYPAYRFAKHKGYGTREHYAALLENGPSPVHRRTFLRTLEKHTAT